MKLFDVKAGKRKKKRFQRPEFQRKLERARRYARKPKEKPKGLASRLLILFGFKSRVGRVTAIVFILLVVFYLAISSTFLITQAVVEQGGPASKQIEDVLFRLQKERTFLIPQNHVILLSRDNFLEALQKEVPDVRDVTSYQRIPPNKLKISVEMREPKYIWKTGIESYFMDQEGVIFQRVLNYDPAVLQQPLVVDKTGQEVVVGQKIKIEKALSFLKGLEDYWSEEISNLQYTGITLPGTASIDIFVTTNLGFEVFFDLNRGAKGQLQNLELLLTQEIPPETHTGLKYIDLRLSNVGYYCYRDAECAGEGVEL